MERRLSRATTRTRRSAKGAAAYPLLRSDQIVHSPETGVRYRVERLLGFGGYGQVYLSRRVTPASDIPEVLCIKISPYILAFTADPRP